MDNDTTFNIDMAPTNGHESIASPQSLYIVIQTIFKLHFQIALKKHHNLTATQGGAKSPVLRSRTASNNISSSRAVHAPFLMLGSSTFVHRVLH